MNFNPKKIITGIKTPELKLRSSSGYIAVFSFLVMVTVLGTLIGVFSMLVSRNVFIARTGGVDLENIYAAEGFVEDTFWRLSSPNWADTANGETLTVGDSTVSTVLSAEDSIKSYYFSAQTRGKYFKNEIAKFKIESQSAKIKDWKDSL